MLHSVDMEPAPALTIRPWADTVVDRVGHDARSRYVEQFWLGVLGPSTTWFLRLVAHRLDREPDGFDLDLRATARSLGLGAPEGRHAPLHRTVERTVRFGLARTVGHHGLDVRRRLPPLNRGQVARLPEPVRRAHADWQEHELVNDRFEEAQRRARRLALSLFEIGEDPDAVERELHRWHHHPALASAATAWALDRHRAAADAAAATITPTRSGA
jgi:hypothetical protein